MNLTRNLSRNLAIAASLLPPAFPAAAQLDDLTFTTETILADGEWNNPTAVAIDDAGAIHIAYMTQHDIDSSTKEIWYATNGGGTWSFQQITDNTVREEFPGIALDVAGNVHIAFHTGTSTTNKIRYVNNVGGSFNPIIDITGGGYKIVDLEVDSAGTVHFTFTSQTSNFTDEVYYTTWDAVGGVAPLLNLSNSSGSEGGPDLALDSNDNVHLAYIDGFTSGPLVYLNDTSGSFAPVPTGVAGSVRNPMVLVGPGDVVSIIYRAGDFLYVVDDGGTGVFGPPTQLYSGSYRPSFYENAAVDVDGHRYIAFASNVNDNRGIFFVGETAAGFADPVQLYDSDSGNQGASVAVNGDGALVVTHQYGGFDPGPQVVFANISVSTAQLGGSACPEDTNGDNVVDVLDLLAVLSDWGQSGTSSDVNGDGIVDVLDLLAVLSAWGPC